MLAPLVRNEIVDVWYDTKIKPSDKWREEIRKAMETASVAVMLVSDNFLASDFINKQELPYFLQGCQSESCENPVGRVESLPIRANAAEGDSGGQQPGHSPRFVQNDFGAKSGVEEYLPADRQCLRCDGGARQRAMSD
jgi:hypothetical protein